MRSPVNGTAPASAPGRSAPLAADRLRSIARRLVLIAVAVGAGFVVAALFQGPAAADGTHSRPGAEPQRKLGALVEPVVRLTDAQRPDEDRQRATRADERRRDRPGAPLAGLIGGVVAPHGQTSTTEPRRGPDAPPASVPPPRADASVPPGAAEPDTLQPASGARAAHRAAHRAEPPRRDAGAPRQPATADVLNRHLARDAGLDQRVPDPPTLHVPGGSPVVGLITAPLPYVVDILNAVPIRPLVTALLHVVDAVLPPVLDTVVVPAATAPPPVPPALGPGAVAVTDPAPVPTVPPPPADPSAPLGPAAAPPTPAVPTQAPAVGPAPHAASMTGHRAAPREPVDAAGEFSGLPVIPVDQDAAGVDDRSKPGPGLARPVDRQSHLGAAQPGDLAPLLVESRTPAAIARPG
ncbi:hypothetical protein ACGFIH_27465 [Micromonospora parva]|uniref:hypothetical protein n=1 Tax=Micromonospora parva TaxID=1464048 RepID=UPI003713C821